MVVTRWDVTGEMMLHDLTVSNFIAFNHSPLLVSATQNEIIALITWMVDGQVVPCCLSCPCPPMLPQPCPWHALSCPRHPYWLLGPTAASLAWIAPIMPPLTSPCLASVHVGFVLQYKISF